MQYGFLAINHQCVASIVSTLKAHHRMGAIGKQIHNFSLAFIAPLRADYDDVLAQWSTPLMWVPDSHPICTTSDRLHDPFAALLDQFTVTTERAYR